MDWGKDKLEVQSGQMMLTSRQGGRPFAGVSTGTVNSCVHCPEPIAIINGPGLVVKPCPGQDVSEFQAVLFDASSSFGTAAAPLISVTWDLVLGTSALLSAAINMVNNQTAVM